MERGPEENRNDARRLLYVEHFENQAVNEGLHAASDTSISSHFSSVPSL